MPKGLISNVQYLRAFAALAVVLVHATSRDGLQTSVSFGKFGVDVFFVISGFIMCQITATDTSHFFLKRVIRIVPSYWAVTLFLFCVAIMLPQVFHHTSADTKTLLYSLFFIPHERIGQLQPWPLLQVGWTLNYEMYFYAIFAVALTVSQKFSQLICALAIAAVLIATNVVDPRSSAEAYYGQPIVLEFLYGMAVYQFFRLTNVASTDGSVRDTGFYLLVLALLAIVVWLPFQEIEFGESVEFLTAGVPATLAVVAAITLEQRYHFFGKNKYVLILGEASYILYLTHQFVVFGVIRMGLRSALIWPEWSKWPLILLLLLITSGVAMVLHIYAEKPTMKWLRRALIRQPPPVIFQNQ